MIEVFKTNVEDSEHAAMLIGHIHSIFTDYKANFDLEDCDRILRVSTNSGEIESSLIIELLKSFGFWAEILPDEEVSIINPVKDLKDIFFTA